MLLHQCMRVHMHTYHSKHSRCRANTLRSRTSSTGDLQVTLVAVASDRTYCSTVDRQPCVDLCSVL